jgi:hypothetical protein
MTAIIDNIARDEAKAKYEPFCITDRTKMGSRCVYLILKKKKRADSPMI